jgi:hypothetical protein
MVGAHFGEHVAAHNRERNTYYARYHRGWGDEPTP